MAIKTTKWSPDTCSCIIEYEWNTDDPESTRQHTIARYLQRCALHSTATSLADLWSKVIEHNTRKNLMYKAVLDNITAATETDAEGNVVLRAGYTFSWSYSGDMLTITLGGSFTNAQKNTIRTWLTNNGYSGKVTVV